MRLEVRLPRGFVGGGFDVRDPSLPKPIGRVVHFDTTDDDVLIEMEFDEDALRARLAEPRRPF